MTAAGTYLNEVWISFKIHFLGGMLTSLTELREQVEKAGLNVERSIEFGQSYNISLRRWHEMFNETWDQISEKGFDDRLEVVLVFRPICSLVKVDHGFISGC